ncbi:aminopeptidase N [Acidocella sp.]|uniref:aminopeptidase N n=1 Tax=Acidocella sp. TaxID=50710 RepID=UPI00261C2978|nr:aminopeptidase N [Acidocella sp.]
MTQALAPARTPVLLADYARPDFTVSHVDLTFTLSPAETLVRSTLTLHRQTEAAVLKLDGQGLHLLEISLDGEALDPTRYLAHPDGLTVTDVPDRCTLTTLVKLNPAANTELSGLYMSRTGFFTQCEPEGFRRITYFPDRPDVMSRYRVRLEAAPEACPVLLSNGNKLEEGETPAGLRYALWEDPHPKPCYLFALVAARLVAVKDEFTTRSGRKVDLAIWVASGDEGRCQHAMNSLKRAMEWDEDTFGLEYDLDLFNIAAVPDFNAGAMENKGLNIFNTAYVLASPDTATDTDFQNVERVIAHEYFHNYTGNRVTCRDWFQLSLKEGLTVFRDQEYMADRFSPAVKRIGDVRHLRATQFRDDAGPLAHPVRPSSYLEINNFYTTTIYEKGAELVRMVRTLIGREAFRRGLRLYLSRHDNQAATVEEFLAAMQDAEPLVDLGGMMDWYAQAGTPEISFEDAYSPMSNTYVLSLRQHTAPTPGQPEKPVFIMPVTVALLDEDGQEMATKTLHFTSPEQSFTFGHIPKPPTPSLFRGFSAPIRLTGYTRERLAFLAARDTDLFNRWDALQHYATQVLHEAVEAHQNGLPFHLDDGLTQALSATLRQAPRDPAFCAEALILPSETLLAERFAKADPTAIHTVREATRRALGLALHERLNAAYWEYGKIRPNDISGPGMAARALKNAALTYLVAAGEVWRAGEQFHREDTNMTDKLAALSLLADTQGERRDEALASFHDEWQDNALVMDKWFAAQARAAAPDTLPRVRALSAHPAFDWRNPNRVRALFATFAANPARFHDPSGEGYQLLADAVLKLDATNPQLAARLSTGLGTWRRFIPQLSGLMRAELERILSHNTLSQNVFEMTSKALA